MKNRILVLSVLLILLSSGLSAGLWADSASLSYVEGQVTIERAGSNQRDAAIGDSVITGDTIYTGGDGFAEISMDSGSTISIQAGTVFNVGEVADPEAESRKRGFFRVLLGSVGFKFRNLTQEPDVGTPLAVCSVRGTDFTVFTAPDGASMTVVSDGLVEVSSGGESALLGADEGIEVVVGLGLGERFDAQKGVVRYDAFAKQALARLEGNPSEVISVYTDQLRGYIEDGEFFLKSHDTNKEELRAQKAKVPDIRTKDGDEAANKFLMEEVGPLQSRGLDLNSTYRFHFISGLMMRRYVISSIYVQLRTKYLADSANPLWLDFSAAYGDFLALYEEQLLPLLEIEDL